jgi:hypothetical protein
VPFILSIVALFERMNKCQICGGAASKEDNKATTVTLPCGHWIHLACIKCCGREVRPCADEWVVEACKIPASFQPLPTAAAAAAATPGTMVYDYTKHRKIVPI